MKQLKITKVVNITKLIIFLMIRTLGGSIITSKKTVVLKSHHLKNKYMGKFITFVNKNSTT